MKVKVTIKVERFFEIWYEFQFNFILLLLLLLLINNEKNFFLFF